MAAGSEVAIARGVPEQLHMLAVREILRATAAALPLQEILNVIANIMIIVTDASTSWLMLAEDGRLRTVAARGDHAERLQGTVCEDGASRACEAVAAGEPRVLRSEEIDPKDPILGPFARDRKSVV